VVAVIGASNEPTKRGYRAVQTLTTMPLSRNMGIDPATHAIYLAGAKFAAPPSGRGRPPMEPGSFVILVVDRSP